MAKVKVFDADSIMKYNHNHDPATGRFTTGSGGSSGGSGGSGGVDYEGTRREMVERLEQMRNHPKKDEKPKAHEEAVAQWEHRIAEFDRKYGPEQRNRWQREKEQHAKDAMKQLYGDKLGERIYDYAEAEKDCNNMIKELQNHPAKYSNPRAWEAEVMTWTKRAASAREKKEKLIASAESK